MTLRTLNQSSWEVGSSGPSSFNGLNALKMMGLHGEVRLTHPLKEFGSTLQSLKGETHPEIFSANLFALAQRLEGRGYDEASQKLYHALQLWNPDSKWGLLASRRSAVLSGEGRLAEKIERLATKLMPAVADPASLGAMFTALRVFKGVSWGLMTYMGGTAWTHKATATVGAFVFEVPAFTLTHRALQSQFNSPISIPNLTIQDELVHAAVSLGALKAFGLAGAHAVKGLGQKGITSRFLPQSVMFLGVLGAQGVETGAGLRKFTGTESFLLDGASTWLHFNMAGKILGPLLPPESVVPRKGPRAPFISPAWVPATSGGVNNGVAIHGKAFSNGPRGLFPGFFSKGGSASSPKPQLTDTPPGESRSPSSDILPSGNTLAYESMRNSFGEFQGTIQDLYAEFIPLEKWVQDLIPISAQMMRETKTLAELVREGDAASPLLPTFDVMQNHLRRIDRGLKEFDIGIFVVSPQQVKNFLAHYYRFPNKMVNFINATDSLENALEPLTLAKQHMEFLLEAEKIPRLPILGEAQTLFYRQEIQRLGAEIHQLCLFGLDPQWPLKTSMAFRELSSILNKIRTRSHEEGHSPFLLGQLESLQAEVDGIALYLDRLATTSSQRPLTLEPIKVLKILFQVPDSLADFMMDTDALLLINANRFAKEVRITLEKSPFLKAAGSSHDDL